MIQWSCIASFFKLNMTQICDNHIHFNLNLANSAFFHPLEVVDRGSETQLQVDEYYVFLVYSSESLLLCYWKRIYTASSMFYINRNIAKFAKNCSGRYLVNH